MQILLIILRSFFILVATLAGILIGVSFSRAIREKYPFLRKLDGKKHIVLIVFIITASLGSFFQSALDILGVQNKSNIIDDSDRSGEQKDSLANLENDPSNNNSELRVDKTFHISSNFKNNILVQEIRKLTNYNYTDMGSKILIDFSYTGQILELKNQQGLYYYPSGSLVILINDKECQTIHDLKIERSLPYGNPFNDVEKELRIKIKKLIDENIKIISSKISECIILKKYL